MTTKTLSPGNLGKGLGKAADLWTWWIETLKRTIPKAWQTTLFPKGNELRIPITPVILETFNPEKFLESVPAGTEHLTLEVDESLLFTKAITVPEVAAGEIQKVIEIQAHRLFPLEADRVYLAWKREGKGKATIYILKRETIDPPIKFLQEARKDLRLKVLPSRADASAFNISSGGLKFTWRVFKNSLVLSLIGWGLMALGYVVYLGYSKGQLEMEIEAVQQNIQQEMAFIEAYEGQARLAGAIAAAQAKGSPLRIFNEISSILPESAWVDELALTNGKVTLTGLANDPPRLVAALSESGFVAEASLISSEEVGEKSRFQIVLILSPNIPETVNE